MKTTSINSYIAATLLLTAGLAACSQDDALTGGNEIPDNDAIRITATVGDFTDAEAGVAAAADTRANINEDGTGSFENGDEIGLWTFIYDATNISNPYPDAPGNMHTLTYESGVWNGFTLTWIDLGEPTDDNDRCFSSFYPKPEASSVSDRIFTFNVATDQSDETAYKASDLLFAYQNYRMKPQDGSVTLYFIHFMTRIKVTLLGDSEIVNKATVIIKNVSAQCRVYIPDGSVLSVSPTLTEIIPRKSGAGIFDALVPSQAVTNGLELAISVDNKVMPYKVAIPPYGWLYSGEQYSIELTLTEE